MKNANKVLFVGSKELGLNCLKTIYSVCPENLVGVATLDDSGDPRSVLELFKKFASRYEIPFITCSKRSDLTEAVERFSPDVCLVICWYWMVDNDLLRRVRLGWIGIHGSMLPRHRGMAPLVWPLLRGETESGVSLFYFDEGMDTGDIIDQIKFHITKDDTILDVLHKVNSISPELIMKNISSILSENNRRVSQDHSQATYGAPRFPKDGLINWSQATEVILNQIRALTTPYPGAFTFVGEKKVIVLKARKFPYPYNGVPGRIAQIKEGKPVVCTGDSAIILDRYRSDIKLKFGSDLR